MKTESHRTGLNPMGLSVEYRVVIGMLVWLGLLSIGSVFVSLPYFSEASAAAAVAYGHVMYLHGLLIGMVGLLALVAMDVFQCQHRGLRSLVLWGTLGATVLSGVGGIFDRSVHDSVALWIQIASFMFLDEILVTLTVSLFIRARATGQLTAWVGTAAAASAFLAAIMGHLAGWLIEFGAWPPALTAYAHFMGVSVATWTGFLVTSHSHEMVAAVLALLAATLVAGFTHREAATLGPWVRIGLWDTLAGTVLMTLIYVVAGFTQAQPPTLFASGPHGINGIAGDDLVTGLGVMLGGTLALVGVALEKLEDAPARWASAAFSAMILVTVVVVGYYIELHETVFGAGAAAPGSAADAVFTFWHQDFAFFIVPSVMVLLQIVHRMVHEVRERVRITALSIAGGGVAFLGGLGYVLTDPSRFGPAFWVTALGFALILLALVDTIRALLASAQAGHPVGTSALGSG